MSNKAEPYRKFWNYEVALYRGDKLIDSGTIKEIAERRGVRKDTIRVVSHRGRLSPR